MGMCTQTDPRLGRTHEALGEGFRAGSMWYLYTLDRIGQVRFMVIDYIDKTHAPAPDVVDFPAVPDAVTDVPEDCHRRFSPQPVLKSKNVLNDVTLHYGDSQQRTPFASC
jgi:hypothetical protein